MTPLIAEMCKLVPDAELSMWFDIGKIKTGSMAPISIICDTPLPFDNCAVVGLDGEHKFAMVLRQFDDMVSVVARVLTVHGFKKHPEFTYIRKSDGFRAIGIDGKQIPKSSIEGVIATISSWLQTMAHVQPAYKPTARRSFINSKRAAKGLAPILFDWHTVTIEPPPAKSEHQGGTHASPRLHDRRGHWRKHSSGKVVWVKSCKVGDASKGVVFKDYEVKA